MTENVRRRGESRRRKTSSKKPVALLLALTLSVGGAVGGTIAWLTAKTTPVTNTFTSSDINITLAESDNLNLQMIPGCTIKKDPVITVEADSEDCWLFVKIDESDNFDEYLSYTVLLDDPEEAVEGWTQGDGTYIPDNVYYRKVDKSTENQPFRILKDDQVTVLSDVTKEMMEAIDGKNEDADIASQEEADRPTLTFTAYAVQRKNSNTTEFEAKDAWAEAAKLESSGSVETP